MKYQTDPQLGPFINHWGCHLCSILEKVEKKTGASFSFGDIHNIYHNAMDQGFVSQEVVDEAGNPADGCTILDGAGLFNLASQFVGSQVRASSYTHEAAGYQTADGEEEILCCHRSAYNGFHFMSGDGLPHTPWQGEIEFDPIECHTLEDGTVVPGSWTQGDGSIESKRILRFV